MATRTERGIGTWVLVGLLVAVLSGSLGVWRLRACCVNTGWPGPCDLISMVLYDGWSPEGCGVCDQWRDDVSWIWCIGPPDTVDPTDTWIELHGTRWVSELDPNGTLGTKTTCVPFVRCYDYDRTEGSYWVYEYRRPPKEAEGAMQLKWIYYKPGEGKYYGTTRNEKYSLKQEGTTVLLNDLTQGISLGTGTLSGQGDGAGWRSVYPIKVETGGITYDRFKSSPLSSVKRQDCNGLKQLGGTYWY